MKLKIVSWNINSVRLRLPLIEAFVAQEQPDVLCLQETKCHDAEFPLKGFKNLNYPHMAIAGQKGYHGVAIASRTPFTNPHREAFCRRGEARHIGVSLDIGADQPLRVDNLYIPAGGDTPDRESNDKFDHKISFYEALTAWSKTLDAQSNQILLGDFNIAPHENDVWNHKYMLKVVSHTPIELETMANLKAALPWHDCVRHIIPETEKLFSWWSYRSKDWQTSNRGLRLDHIWANEAIAKRTIEVRVAHEWRSRDKPSDHAPVIASFEV